MQWSEGIYVNYIIQQLFSLVFLPNWEDQKMWARRDYFSTHFLSLLFSLLNQIRENVIFYLIFLSLFSSITIFIPTKHTLKIFAISFQGDMLRCIEYSIKWFCCTFFFYINKVKHFTQISRKTHITIINGTCKCFFRRYCTCKWFEKKWLTNL